MREKIIINKSKTKKKTDFIKVIKKEREPYNGGKLTNFPNWESLELYCKKKKRKLNPSIQKK